MDSAVKPTPPDFIERVRFWLLCIIVIGLLGTVTELVLLKHYEQPLQYVPLVLIGALFGVLGWHGLARNGASLQAMKIVCGLFVVSGFLGMSAHFHGSAEFQRELNPTIGLWDLMEKILHAQAPPLLAPGMMLQLGLLGLAYVLSDAKFRNGKS